jgi:hypothetical protein
MQHSISVHSSERWKFQFASDPFGRLPGARRVANISGETGPVVRFAEKHA